MHPEAKTAKAPTGLPDGVSFMKTCTELTGHGNAYRSVARALSRGPQHCSQGRGKTSCPRAQTWGAAWQALGWRQSRVGGLYRHQQIAKHHPQAKDLRVVCGKITELAGPNRHKDRAHRFRCARGMTWSCVQRRCLWLAAQNPMDLGHRRQSYLRSKPQRHS